MTNHQNTTPHTPLETALIAARASRAAELSQQMTLLLLRSMQRQVEAEQV